MKLIGNTINRPKATKHAGNTINRPKATKHTGDTDNRPKAVKLIGDTINRPMATNHTGDTDNRPKAVKLSGDTINRPKATKRNGDTDNLRNDAKYAVRPNGNPVGLFFHRVGDEKLAEARSRCRRNRGTVAVQRQRHWERLAAASKHGVCGIVVSYGCREDPPPTMDRRGGACCV